MKAKTDTIARTALLVLAMINQILTMLGKKPLPFAETEIYEIVSIAAMAGTALWAWWKNNSFTKKAIMADGYLESLKKGGGGGE